MERDAAWMPPYRPLAAFSSSSSSEENDMDQVKMMRRERDRRLKLGRGDDDGEDAEGQSGQGEGADDCMPTDLHRVNLGVMRAVDDISVYGACGREMLTQALVSFVHARVVALFSTSRCSTLESMPSPLPFFFPCTCVLHAVYRCLLRVVDSDAAGSPCSAIWRELCYPARCGLRECHQGNGYDPHSQDIAREVGYPFFPVSSELNRSFLRVQDLSEEDKSEADEELSGNAPQDDLRPSLFQISSQRDGPFAQSPDPSLARGDFPPLDTRILQNLEEYHGKCIPALDFIPSSFIVQSTRRLLKRHTNELPRSPYAASAQGEYRNRRAPEGERRRRHHQKWEKVVIVCDGRRHVPRWRCSARVCKAITDPYKSDAELVNTWPRPTRIFIHGPSSNSAITITVPQRDSTPGARERNCSPPPAPILSDGIESPRLICLDSLDPPRSVIFVSTTPTHVVPRSNIASLRESFCSTEGPNAGLLGVVALSHARIAGAASSQARAWGLGLSTGRYGLASTTNEKDLCDVH
ncbi:hypothetical protein DFH09DRAFT_1397994 [Mycena vulgaris]|nr:hypothetical protein DFH09DRAFT_1397994 [Mycena vulgaris]